MDQMDITPSSITTKSSKLNRKISWPEASSIKQIFRLPDSIIYYITKNPSTPEVYLKLAQSCKYFFEKNSIIIAACIHGVGRALCTNQHEDVITPDCKGCVKFDIVKLTSKIWLTDELKLYSFEISNFASIFLSKLYRCEEAKLTLLWNIFKLKDFQMLGSKFQKFYFSDAAIFDNGSKLMLDRFLKSIPCVKEFEYFNSSGFGYGAATETTSTIKNFLKLQNLHNLSYLKLWCIPGVLCIDNIAEFIKNHKDTKICLTFCLNISDGYKNKLDQLIDIIIASDISNSVINYQGQDEDKFRIMKSRYSR